MPHPRTFRFGVQAPSAPSAQAWTELARKAEDLGYSTLLLPDHFGDQLAPVPAMQAAADATTDLRVGCLVFDNDYKHPVVLAKEVATIDVLSGGRVELGIGAGWLSSDYEQSGIQHDRAGVRIDRMEEGIAVLKGLFAEGAYSFVGDHYTITGLDGRPKPLQRPHPPFLIGGGAKRVLTIAGREADIVGVNPSIASGRVDAAASLSGAAEATDQKLEWVKAGAGDRYDELEINMLIFAAILTDDKQGTTENMAPLFSLDPAGLDAYPHVWIGSAESICADLEQRRRRVDHLRARVRARRARRRHRQPRRVAITRPRR
jgi:probable F420-dependent oxidoreductase